LKGIGKSSVLSASLASNISVQLRELRINWDFVVTDDISDDVILGLDFFTHFHAVIDLSTLSLSLCQ